MSIPLISYAQNFEDVMLWRALRNVANGFYIDIGAHDPRIDSVSRLFYEHGWRGMHLEPLPVYCNALRVDRPDESVIQAAVADKPGVLTFYEIPDTGISTASPEIAAAHRQRGFVTHEMVVPTVTLEQIFEQTQGKAIHWLKIDVEGLEDQVLSGWGNAVAMPWVVVVESTLPLTQQESFEEWEHHLLTRGYSFAYFDGLNRFYLSPSHDDLRCSFTAGPNVFDGFALSGQASSPFCHAVQEGLRNEHSQHAQQFNQQNEQLQQQLAIKDQAVQASQACLSQIEVELRNSQEALVERERVLGCQLLEARDESKSLLQTMVQREQALGLQLLSVHQQATDQAAEQLRYHADQAHVRHGQLMEQQQALAQQLRAEQLENRQLQQDWAKRESVTSHEIHALQTQAQALGFAQQLQAQQHCFEISTQQGEYQRLNQSTAEIQARLHSELAAEKQVALDIAQTLAVVQEALAMTHATLSWRMTAPLRTFSSLISTKKPLNHRQPSGANSATPPSTITPKAAVRPADPQQSTAQPEKVEAQINTSSPLSTMNIPAVAKTLNELLALHDQRFVVCAYHTLLGRAPDPEGLSYYLSRLRLGFSQIQVLSQLRRSAEGKGHATKLPGLNEAIQINQRGRKPLIGWMFRLLEGTEGNHATERKLRSIENQLFLLSDESNRRFNQMEAALTGLQHLVVQQTESSSIALRDTERANGDTPIVNLANLAEADGVKQLTPRARDIYQKLKTAVTIHAARTSACV